MNTWLFVTGLAGALLVVIIIAGCAISWAVLELARKNRAKRQTRTVNRIIDRSNR